MPLSKKDRVRNALMHSTVDRLPTQINYTQALGECMTQDFGGTVDFGMIDLAATWTGFLT